MLIKKLLREGVRMHKVFIVGTDFRWYTDSIERAFASQGCETRKLATHLGPNKWNLFIRLKIRFGLDVAKFINKKKDAINKKALKMFNEFNPDIMYVVLGNQLTPETVTHMKQTATTVLFLSDTFEYYKEAYDIVHLYDLIYSYELTDIQLLEKENIYAKPSMGSFDEYQYFPMSCEKDIDVSFVGKMYPERKELLNRLMVDLPNVKFSFYGEYAKLRHPILFFQWLFSKKRRVFKNKNIHFSKTNEIYNRSKICLNVHCAQTKKGWSSRLPEILGSGAFQIVDYNEAIADEFHNCLYTYKNYEELVKSITYFLNHDEERNLIAKNGYEYVIRNHSMNHRIKEILGDIDRYQQNSGVK